MTTIHPLTKELAEESQERCKDLAKQIIRSARDSVAIRRQWIENRQKQITELESLQDKVYAAYDEINFQKLSGLKEELDRLRRPRCPTSLQQSSRRISVNVPAKWHVYDEQEID